jgi:RNA polymerase primary sigma factor
MSLSGSAPLFEREGPEPEVLLKSNGGRTAVRSTLASFRAIIGRYPVLADEEQARLFAQLKNGRGARRARALDILLKSNLGLVLRHAYRFVGRDGWELDDLLQTGALTLLKAIERYDPTRGRFPNFASGFISWRLKNAIRDCPGNGQPIRIPAGVQDEFGLVRREYGFSIVTKGAAPDDEELLRLIKRRGGKAAEKMNLGEVRRVRRLLVSRNFSLDQGVVSARKQTTPHSLVADRDSRSEKALAALELREEAERLIAVIEACLIKYKSRNKQRDTAIIRLHLGLADGERWTLERIAKRFEITRERVRQIKARFFIKNVISQVRAESIAAVIAETNETAASL